MKQLICEMCGSTDLIKQDGVFVCQSCGCKYSAEDAKRMMIEGPIDVSGSTVKVDTSDELTNLYQIARRARDDNNAESAAKYYERILAIEPNSWEAYFYTNYYNTLQSKIAYIDSSIDQFISSLDSTFSLVAAECNQEEQFAAVNEISVRTWLLARMVFESVKKTFYNNCEHNHIDYGKFLTEYVKQTTTGVVLLLIALANQIESKFLIANDEQYKAIVLTTLKEASDFGFKWWNSIHEVNKNTPGCREIGENLSEISAKLIRKYEPDYKTKISEVPQHNSQEQTAGGCYVATAVYGSYDCPQVWTLRRYRDETLAGTLHGRVFIKLYYAVSPTLVKWFGKTNWFKKMWKGKLDNMVAQLQAKGVASTPYEDRAWK